MTGGLTPNIGCTHMRVSYRTETFVYDGPDIPVTAGSSVAPLRAGTCITRGWWECDSGCGMRFVPSQRDGAA